MLVLLRCPPWLPRVGILSNLHLPTTPSTPNITTPPSPHTHILFTKFKEVLTEFGIDWQSDVLLRRLFEAFDRSRSGSVDFREFVLGLSIASKGTPNEKLDLSFKVYDIDGTGEVRKAEMVQVLSSVHRAARGRSTLGGNVDKFVAGLFEQADKTKNGTLTYLEYARAAMRFPNILEFKLAGDVDEEEKRLQHCRL